jgi:hypothetical protein
MVIPYGGGGGFGGGGGGGGGWRFLDLRRMRVTGRQDMEAGKEMEANEEMGGGPEEETREKW